MAYWERPVSVSSPSLDSTTLSGGHKKGKSIADEFYEIEPAIVLDVILDSSHPFFKNADKLIPDQWPVGVNGTPPDKTDPDYTWIGRVLVRMLYSQRNVEKEDLIWAMPLESNVSEYPVLNETVGVVFYLGQFYYTRKINMFNTPNADVDFNLELQAGGFRTNPNGIVQGNRELINKSTDPKIPFSGPPSKLNSLGSVGYIGAMGRYFYYNPRIRSLKRREGDLVFESRFGQSIRFAAYDDIRSNDKGYSSDFSGYTDYKGTGIQNPYSKTEAGGGNPMIIIRNRQRPLNKNSVDEKNVGGYMLEDINNDGSSIHLTSGVTLSSFQPTCFKKMWGNGSEEQSAFNGTTSFRFPKLIGDQMVLNSDRVIISAKKNELFQYAKQRMSFVTDSEYTVDSQDQMVFTTNNKTVINSPAIYLGEYNQTNEPVLLGQTSVNWLYDLCNWLLIHTHWYNHNHPDAQGGTVGAPNPNQTQTSVQAASLLILQNSLNTLLSRRVFVTGGGFAPGFNGGTITNGAAPVSITLPAGTGIPGGWTGSNRKFSAAEKQQIQSQIGQITAVATSAQASSAAATTSAASAAAAANTVAGLVAQVSDSITQQANTIASQQAALAKTNAALAAQYAQTAQSAANTVATSTNEALILESNAQANDAADKAKYYAGLADTQNKAAQASIAKAQAEVTKVQAEEAAQQAALGIKTSVTRFTIR